VRQKAKQSGGSRIARCGRAILVLALLSGVTPRRADCGTPSEADRAEARYLKKMLSFVEWPSNPGTPDEPFRVCVAPDYRIIFPLSEELRGITVKGRTIDVQMIRKEDNLKNCRVLFIGSPEPKLRAKLLESVKGTQMLTVGDDAGFLEAGGILEFAYAGNTIQFSVNLPAAKRAGLKIDSRLLAIAQRVLTEKEATGI
jgi:YfiR/HmsC-like